MQKIVFSPARRRAGNECGDQAVARADLLPDGIRHRRLQRTERRQPDEEILPGCGRIIHRGGDPHTARAPDFKDRALQEKAVRCLRDAGIEGVVVIGGGGSFHGAQALQELGMKTVGIPATIDNDIPGTGSAIGFDTAVNTILDAINRLRDTATSHERIFIVEVMGRESGFIALAAGIAGGAEAIIVPEIKPDLDEICRRLLQGIARKKTHSLIIAAEGAASAYEVGKVVHERTGLETRVTVLGHIQRGGSPSAVDRLLGSRMGAVAVELLRRDCSGVMTAQRWRYCPRSPVERNHRKEKAVKGFI